MKNLVMLWDSLPTDANNNAYLQELQEIVAIDYFNRINENDFQDLNDEMKTWLKTQYQTHLECQNHRLSLLSILIRIFHERPLDIYCWLITHQFEYKTTTTYGQLFDVLRDQPKDLLLKLFVIAGLNSNSIDRLSISIENNNRNMFAEVLRQTNIDLSTHMAAMKVMTVLSELFPLFQHIGECYNDNCVLSDNELQSLIEKIKSLITDITDSFIELPTKRKVVDEKSIVLQRIMEKSMDLYLFDYHAKDQVWLSQYLERHDFKDIDDLIEMCDPLWIVIEATILGQVLPYLNDSELIIVELVNNKLPILNSDFESIITEASSFAETDHATNKKRIGESITNSNDDNNGIENQFPESLKYTKMEYRQLSWIAGVLSGITDSGIKPRFSYIEAEEREAFIYFISGRSYNSSSISKRKIRWGGSSYSLKYFFILLNMGKEDSDESYKIENLPHNYSSIISNRFTVVSKNKYTDVTEATIKGISLTKATDSISLEEKMFLEKVVQQARNV